MNDHGPVPARWAWVRRPSAWIRGRDRRQDVPDQEKAFGVAVDRALATDEIKAALRKAAGRGTGAPAAAGILRGQVENQKESLLAQPSVVEAETAYRQALAQVSIAWSGRPWLGLLRLVVVFAALVLFLVACVMYGWATSLDGPVGSFRDVSVVSGTVLGTALLVLAVGGLIGSLSYGAFRFLMSWRPEEALVIAVVFVAALATIFLGVGTTDVVANFSDSDSGARWGWFAFVLAAATYVLFFMAPIREWWLAHARPRATSKARAAAAELEQDWRNTLQEAVLALCRAAVQADVTRGSRIMLAVQEAPGLRRVRDAAFHVPTEAEHLLVRVSSGMDGGSIALSGPRGVGKTELLEAFCAGSSVASGAPVGLSVVVTAPVDYDRREFMLHLFAEFCERVRTHGTRPLRKQASEHLRWIRYLRTIASGRTIAWRILSITRGSSFARVAPSYPEIVSRFKLFLKVVADHLMETGNGRLVIGIDELDLIHPTEIARIFLNEIKVIFDVPNCLFVLSVSDDALREADLTQVGRRDVFDSAIDEVIRVGPLDQQGAGRLLDYRVIGVDEGFIGLFNGLAGGIPRDLLRIARAAILFGRREQGECLPDTAERLVGRELDRIINSLDTDITSEILGLFHGGVVKYGELREMGERVTRTIVDSPERQTVGITIANHFFFLDTILGIFFVNLDGNDIQEAADPSTFFWRSLTALAKTRSIIGIADQQARLSLQRIREAWGLEPIPS